MKLYDAAACPFCARVRLVLGEKGLAYEAVEIDLAHRPPWLSELNPAGRVPVLEDGFVLPESLAIMEYLDERHPEPPLLPSDPEQRALARVALIRFDDLIGASYYALRRGGGDEAELRERLERLPLGLSLLSDFAYAPWVIRVRERMSFALPERVETWLERLAERPAVAREIDLVRGLP